MTTLQVILLVVAGAAIVVCAVFFLLLGIAGVGKLTVHLLKGPLESRVAAHYGPDEVLMKDIGANCFGLESRGVTQARGNGALVLTRERLHFFMFLPRREFVAPLDAITEVSLTHSHLGKATVFDLLKVRFTADGKPDSLAWYLADPRAWKARIEELTAGARTEGH